MTIILIAMIIIYVLMAVFTAQYMYTTAIIELKASNAFTKKRMIIFKMRAILSGIFFPFSITMLAATIIARKRAGY